MSSEWALVWDFNPCGWDVVQAFLVAQTVKHLPAMQDTLIQSLGWEDPLEKGMASPLQYSCLGNPMERGAWQATVHGVAKIHDHSVPCQCTSVLDEGTETSQPGWLDLEISD